MAGGGEDGIDGIALSACEVITLEQAVGFGVADDRFDGAPAFELATNGGRRDAAHARNVDLGFALVAMPLVGAFDGNAGQSLNLFDLAG